MKRFSTLSGTGPFFISMLFACMMIIFCIGFISDASAQATEYESLPIEIKMLYLKLTKQKPDYNQIIYSNAEFQENRHKFGQEALINQQYILLQRLYNNAGPGQAFHSRVPLQATTMSTRGRSILFPALDIDEPITYTVTEDEVYGIFLTNGDLLAKLAPPYEFDDFLSMEHTYYMQKGRFNVHLVLDPVAADTAPFYLDNGDKVNVILANITELKLIDDHDKKLLLHKRFNDNNGLPVPPIPSNQDYLPLPPAAE